MRDSSFIEAGSKVWIASFVETNRCVREGRSAGEEPAMERNLLVDAPSRTIICRPLRSTLSPIGQPCRRGEDRRQAADRSQLFRFGPENPTPPVPVPTGVLVEVLHTDDRVHVRKDGRRRAHVAVVVVKTERFHEGAAGQHEADEILYTIRQQDKGVPPCGLVKMPTRGNAGTLASCGPMPVGRPGNRPLPSRHRTLLRPPARSRPSLRRVADDAGLDSGRQLIQHQRAA